MGLSVTQKEVAFGVVLMELKGTVDASVQDALTSTLKEAFRAAEKGVLVSLEGVDFMDSSGIGALMRAWGEAEDQGLKFALVVRRPRLRKLLEVVGLLETIPNFLTVSDALTEWEAKREREVFRVEPLISKAGVTERPPQPLTLPPTVSQWQMELHFACEPEMIAVARLACASFASQMGFGLDEIEDIKLAVSEACTNVIQHAYGEEREGRRFTVVCRSEQKALIIEVRDTGRGISGGAKMSMGMKIIRAVMDEVEFRSAPGQGTIVRMVKRRQA